MSQIQVLPPSIQEKIAAGEVVERPASVVKELVENSLDAGARQISIKIEGGGVEKIRVQDDGLGIDSEDLPIAFTRHATSKIQGEEDLFSIHTFGFRGEALPSIAAISKVEVWSTIRGGGSGYRMRIEGGRSVGADPVGFPEGTAIEVRDLFYNTPARRKFLKSPSTEFSHIAEIVKRLALSQKEVGIHFEHNQKTVWDVLARFGLEQRCQMLMASNELVEWRPIQSDSAPFCIEGFLSKHPFSLPHSREIHLFVNRRPVRDRILQKALLEACGEVWPSGHYPAALVHVTIPASQVDVNVHPAKHEVRFLRPSEVYNKIYQTVRSSLSARTFSPPSFSFQGEARQVAEPALAGWGTFPLQEIPLISSKGDFGSLKILGQVGGTYLVCEGEEGVVVIDQHAAHERVVFMRLKKAFSQGTFQKEPLLVPEVIDFSPEKIALIQEQREFLGELGFEIEPFGGKSIVVKTVPTVLSQGEATRIFEGIVERLRLDLTVSEKDEKIEHILATLACHSAIRAHDRLSEPTIRSLLEEMDRTDFPYACPHGRPSVHKIPFSEVGKWFER
jgi:DNA mismatch repair protein MutL